MPESLLSPAERVRVAQWHLDAGQRPEQEPLREAVRCALRVHDVPAAIRLSAAAWYGHSAPWAADLHARALFADGAYDDLHTFAEKVAAGHPEHARDLAPVQARALLLEGRQDQGEKTAQQLTGTEHSDYLALAAAFQGHFSTALHHARTAPGGTGPWGVPEGRGASREFGGGQAPNVPEAARTRPSSHAW